jgi:hypothetical protein
MSEHKMAATPNVNIPILTEELSEDEESTDRSDSGDRDALIAELQTQIAASTFALTNDIMRKAFAEMEASIFEQISGRLRRELPEMVDALLRERLGDETDY